MDFHLLNDDLYLTIFSRMFRFFHPDTLESDYNYSESGVYYAPDAHSLAEYGEYVGGLPLSDDPEIFGMHNNANLSFQVRAKISLQKDKWNHLLNKQ